MNKMTNAKDEFLSAITNKAKVKAVAIQYGRYNPISDTKDIHINLYPNYSTNDWNNFLKQLDFNYDSGYGTQELYGIIWLDDDTWFTRSEYDGSEWWTHNELPNISEYLDSNDSNTTNN